MIEVTVAKVNLGNQGFVTVMAEMRDPSRDFVPALYYLQGFALTIYTVVGAIIYALAGEYTASPALGSAPITSAKIAYGIVFRKFPLCPSIEKPVIQTNNHSTC